MQTLDKIRNFGSLLKQALASIAPIEPMQPYQQRVVRRISQPNQPGLVVAHGVGSGKSRTSLEAYKKLKMPTNVIVPASLKNNYNKEVNKWLGSKPGNMDIMSQQMLARKGIQQFDKPGGLLVVDEAHRAREQSSQIFQALQESQARKKLLLTGTPIFNSPQNLSNLVNLAAGKSVLPDNKYDFNDRYVNNVKIEPNILQRLMGLKPGYRPEIKNQRELGKILNKYVDYYPSAQGSDYPSTEEQTIKTTMGDKQSDLYKTIMGKAPLWVRWKVKAGLPPGKSELDSMRAFLSGARQVSNTNYGFVKNPADIQSAKIQQAFDYFKKQLNTNPRYKGVIYSNYLNSGLFPYKQLLNKYNIPYGEFSGEISPNERNEMVKQYNLNKLKALLVSSAGSEGLDLKGTRLVQILEPHYNDPKINQVIGRAVRYKSHSDLPENERNVLIQHYLARPKAGFIDRLFGKEDVRGTDEYISDIARQKTLLSDAVTKLLAKQNNL